MKKKNILFIFILLLCIGLQYETSYFTNGSMSEADYKLMGVALFLALFYMIPATFVLTRLELRSVDPMANPYIAMAVLLEVGLHGIENKIEAPAPIEENIYIMTAEERKEAGITDLPSTLHNALKALTEDEVVKAALGEHIYTSFLEAKRIEWASYATFVSQWEVDNYLDLY